MPHCLHCALCNPHGRDAEGSGGGGFEWINLSIGTEKQLARVTSP